MTKHQATKWQTSIEGRRVDREGWWLHPPTLARQKVNTNNKQMLTWKGWQWYKCGFVVSLSREWASHTWYACAHPHTHHLFIVFLLFITSNVTATFSLIKCIHTRVHNRSVPSDPHTHSRTNTHARIHIQQCTKFKIPNLFSDTNLGEHYVSQSFVQRPTTHVPLALASIVCPLSELHPMQWR